MSAFLRDLSDQLDCGGTCADDRNAFALELDRFLRPAAGMIRGALEAIDSFERRREMRRQDTHRPNQKLRTRPLAVVDLDFPARRLLVINRRSYARIELNVAAQIELVRNIIEIALVLRLTGIMLFPVPFLQQLFREGVAVGFALGIEAATRVAVPIPGAADAVAILIE